MAGRNFGNANGRAKLDAAKVKEMRELYNRGYTTTELSKRYKVTRMMVWYAVVGVNWKEAGGPIARKGEPR